MPTCDGQPGLDGVVALRVVNLEQARSGFEARFQSSLMFNYFGGAAKKQRPTTAFPAYNNPGA